MDSTDPTTEALSLFEKSEQPFYEGMKALRQAHAQLTAANQRIEALEKSLNRALQQWLSYAESHLADRDLQNDDDAEAQEYRRHAAIAQTQGKG